MKATLSGILTIQLSMLPIVQFKTLNHDHFLEIFTMARILKVFVVLLAVHSASAQEACKADLNGNGVVDFADFLFFSGLFGQEVAPCAKDTVVVMRDTVRITIIDTVYIDQNEPPKTNSKLPEGANALEINVTDTSLGMRIVVFFLDEFGLNMHRLNLETLVPDSSEFVVDEPSGIFGFDNLSLEAYEARGGSAVKTIIPASRILFFSDDYDLQYRNRLKVTFYYGSELLSTHPGDTGVGITAETPKGADALSANIYKITQGARIDVRFVDDFGNQLFETVTAPDSHKVVISKYLTTRTFTDLRVNTSGSTLQFLLPTNYIQFLRDSDNEYRYSNLEITVWYGSMAFSTNPETTDRSGVFSLQPLPDDELRDEKKN